MVNRVRLCFLVDTVEANAGVENQVFETVSRIDAARFDLHLCSFQTGPRLEHLQRYCRTMIYPMDSIYTLNGLHQIGRFRKYLNHHHMDVVHAFTSKAALFGVIGANLARCPVIITSRLNTGYWYTPFYLTLFRFLNRHTTRIYANSHGARRATLTLENARPDRVDVIYNGVDIARYSSGQPNRVLELGLPETATVVGIVANLRPVKDHDLFLRAAERVARAVPESAFLLVGDGPLRARLTHLAEDLNIGAKVFFTDGKGSVEDYLSGMAIGCLTSRGEGFSNAILEYMAAGLPVVATDVGGNAEAIADCETGYLVRERTPEAVAAPIIALLRDPKSRIEMGQRGRQRCRELFEINTCIQQQEKYYLSLVQEAQPRPLGGVP